MNENNLYSERVLAETLRQSVRGCLNDLLLLYLRGCLNGCSIQASLGNVHTLDEGQNPLSAVSSFLSSSSHPFTFPTGCFCLPNHFLLTPRLAPFLV